MMGWLDDIPTTGAPMVFEHGETVYRLRPKMVWDRYSKTYIPGDWSDPDELELPGAFIAQSSTAIVTGAARTQVLESKSLYLTDPDADVQVGDRIRQGPTGPAPFLVDGAPAADTNPFTGWRPVREIPLEAVTG
ncbi:hypothetical protein Leucomu_13495 [Leucobacter muris]|uniref:Uncharacterized protein n=1 Tax=Leucobacter muris TaxID=1935379 RepID=A0ABX5QI63_9MICO|nr:hypothetical protein [Leucobacter muris]QAB18788.1 hypothetical protein Leucomu_13495 [Leucobacter muris]